METFKLAINIFMRELTWFKTHMVHKNRLRVKNVRNTSSIEISCWMPEIFLYFDDVHLMNNSHAKL